MDIALTRWINGSAGSTPWLDGVMVAVTTFGVPFLVAATILMWWAKGRRLAIRHACLVAFLAFVGSLTFNQFLLVFLHRIRPYELGFTHLLVSPTPDWSFPSDHATAVSAIVAAFWFQHVRWPLLVGLPLAMLICISRVYVGVHYASDIAGGLAIGTLFAWGISRYYSPHMWPFKLLVEWL